jgi:GAF domain
MDTDRLLRDVERRLSGLDEAYRAEVVDALREEISRERRRVDPTLTVEAERERRLEAENLREVLEAINRPTRLEATAEEVLKQLARVVPCDTCGLALRAADAQFRFLATRGFPNAAQVQGEPFRSPWTDALLESPQTVSVSDADAEGGNVALDASLPIRSWAAIPLLVEGDVIGLVALGRDHVEPFNEDEVHRAKLIAFSAAAAIRRSQSLEQVRRYASLMEQLVALDQAVFAGAPASDLARTILEGAGKVGTYRGGVLVLLSPRGPVVAAAMGSAFQGTEGRTAPADLTAEVIRRLPPERMPEIGEALGTRLPDQEIYLIPLASGGTPLGTLALLDPDGETPDDRLMESYASRAATAYLFATQGRAG